MISVIIPAYNEEDNIKPLYEKLKKVLDKLKIKYEIIFVDDGSKDKTFEMLERIAKKDKRVKVIKFKRNFGQTRAIQAGFDFAKGKIIITMDADLQNDPEDIPALIKKLNEGYDIVSGWRKERKDTFSKKIFSKFSNWLARKLTGIEIHDFGCTLKAYKKDVIKNIRLYGEMHRYIPAIAKWKGAKITEIVVKHHSRKFGKSKYGMKRLIKGFLDLLFIKFWLDFSTRPLHLFGSFGIVQIVAGVLLGIFNLVKYGLNLQVGPLLLLSVLLVLNGFLFLFFGFMGEILIRTYYESKGEKTYTVEKAINVKC